MFYCSSDLEFLTENCQREYERVFDTICWHLFLHYSVANIRVHESYLAGKWVKKMKAISEKLIEEYKETKDKCERLKEKITDRIDDILRTWFKIYDMDLETWYFADAREGEVGDITRNMDSECISNIVDEGEFDNPNRMIFIDASGKEYEWCGEIPIRWLFDDNFEEEIIQGKAEYKKRQDEKRKKSIKKNQIQKS